MTERRKVNFNLSPELGDVIADNTITPQKSKTETAKKRTNKRTNSEKSVKARSAPQKEARSSTTTNGEPVKPAGGEPMRRRVSAKNVRVLVRFDEARIREAVRIANETGLPDGKVMAAFVKKAAETLRTDGAKSVKQSEISSDGEVYSSTYRFDTTLIAEIKAKLDPYDLLTETRVMSAALEQCLPESL